MIRFRKDRLQKIYKNAQSNKIIVFGDLMVDEYLWGDVTRLSPEAPVPIINIASEQIRFGGAANVANNLISLGVEPLLIGVVGNDRMGEQFLKMMQENNLSTEGIVVSDDRPTTVKARIIGNNQHIARVDKESIALLSTEIQEKIFKIFIDNIEKVSSTIIQDYNKGVVVPQLVENITGLSRRHGKAVTVDPKFNNFFEFKDVTVFKPNTKETEEALAMRIASQEDTIKAGNLLLNKLHCDSVLITRGSAGMALFEKGKEPLFIETRAKKVLDVSGAGDTVIATLTFALAGGANLQEAVSLSNYAAGIVCEEVGVVPVDPQRLFAAVCGEK